MTPSQRRAAAGDPLHVSIIAGICLLSVLATAADDPATDKSEHQRQLSECQAQLAGQHPEMDAKARRKACREQVGPAPQGVVPAKAPAPVR